MDISALLNMWKGKSYLGCDLGATCVKVVQCDKVEKGCKLVKTGILKASDLLSDLIRGERIKNFFQENKILPTGHVSVNIENSTLLIRRMSIPKMPERDVKVAIKWNFREFVEGSIDDYIVNYVPVRGFTDGDKMIVSASCISRESVLGRAGLMKDIGLRASFIEPNASALLSVFNYTIKWRPDHYYVMLDLGDAVSNFVVLGNGCLLFSRVLTGIHGRRLQDMVEKDLQLTSEKAEGVLKEYLAASKKESSVPTSTPDHSLGETPTVEKIVSNFISLLVIELQRSIDAFCIMYKKDRVHNIYLCGGGICLPDLAARLSTGLGVDTELFNPFANIREAETISKLPTAPLYAVAVGLALPRE